MAQGNTLQSESFRQGAALAFGVAIVGRVVNSVLHHLGTAMGTAAPEWALDVSILVTYAGASVGLLGIYAWVAEPSPRLSRAGLLAIGITAASIVASLIGKYLVGGEAPTGALLAIPIAFYACSTLSFLLLGVASIRTRVPSSTVGYLLVVVAGSRLLVLVELPEVSSALFVLALLGVGYLIREEAAQRTVELAADEQAI